MMEGAGSVASIRRPINANAAPRSYTADYQYQYSTRGASTATTAATTATSANNNSPTPRRCRCCRTCCSAPAASTLGNLGVCGLVLGYTVLGAFTFMALESGVSGDVGGRALPAAAGNSREHDRLDKIVNDIRSRTVERLWSITEDLNILYKDNWTRLASQEVLKFQDSLVHTLRGSQPSTYRGSSGGGVAQGVTGSTSNYPPNHRWTFSSSFLYSLTLITTIGYGSVTPRTTWGKIVTIIYALVGIPLMLVYLSTIGDLLARNFRRMYGKLCGCHSSGSSSSSSGKPSPNDSYRVRHISSKQNSIDSSLKLHPDEDLVKIERHHPLDFPSDPTTPTDSRQHFLHHHHHHHNNFQAGKIHPPVRVPICLCLFMVAAYICGGAALFNKLENWSFLEGSFFCFTSLGTIGFGDLLPGTQPHLTWKLSQISILSTAAYILIGMALIAMCFNLLQDEVIILGRKFGKLCGFVNKKRRSKTPCDESESEAEDLAMAVVSGTS